MSEERTQIFRGDESPEYGIAETGKSDQQSRRGAPSDQRSVQDQRDGERQSHEIRDAKGRAGQPAQSEASPSALVETREIQDAAGGQGEVRALRDSAEGPSESREIRDAEGPSETREMHDAAGAVEQRRMDGADGPSTLRKVPDSADAQPVPAAAGVALNFNDDVEEASVKPELVPVPPPETLTTRELSDHSDLNFQVERDATPWALSIKLQERIANLGSDTIKVNQQLDGLEESTKRLAKRIGK